MTLSSKNLALVSLLLYAMILQIFESNQNKNIFHSTNLFR